VYIFLADAVTCPANYTAVLCGPLCPPICNRVSCQAVVSKIITSHVTRLSRIRNLVTRIIYFSSRNAMTLPTASADLVDSL
jgi:hypothetical protein